MFGLLACVAACAAGLSLGLSPSGSGSKPEFRCGTVTTGVQQMSSRSVTIQGVSVIVSVDLSRNMMPPVGQRTPNGVMTQVSLKAARDLPSISSVRVTFKKNQRETWKPSLSPVPTFVHDPKSSLFSAFNGPKWQAGASTAAEVTIVSKGRSYKVSMPVPVQGVY